MKNLKISFVLLLILIISGCQTIDETPQIIDVRSEQPIFSEDVDINENPYVAPVQTTMEITVEYQRGFDREAFRNRMTSWFGLRTFSFCISDPNKEVWVINSYTDLELDVILQSIINADPDITVPPGTASGGLRVRTGDPFARDFVYNTVLFYYHNDCQ